jgi:hypothetical protein
MARRRDSQLRTGGVSNYGPSVYKPKASSPDIRGSRVERRLFRSERLGRMHAEIFAYRPEPRQCARRP